MIITLTTDFGTHDPYVAQVKGVILGINPHVEIVDITHEIAPQDIGEAAFLLGVSFSYFPPGTIHIAVVDPGVGSERRAVILLVGHHTFVGPDNGIFSFALERANVPYQAIQILDPPFNFSGGATFHGRDLFAPVAAHLSLGVDPAIYGPEISHLTLSSPHAPSVEEHLIRGTVMHLDRFGNAITNITTHHLPRVQHPPMPRWHYVEKRSPSTTITQKRKGVLPVSLTVRDFSNSLPPWEVLRPKYNLKRGDMVSLFFRPNPEHH